MQAIVVTAPGGPNVLELREVPDPVPREREVVIDVRATALNRADLLQRRGLYAAPPGASDVLGLECAGVVSALGPGVASVRVGDRVMALLGGGGYAERVSVHEQLTLPIPDALNFEQAAAVPEAFLTATEALFRLAKLLPGEWVLVHAAGSGVGSVAVQLARAAGARVLATTSASKRERVATLGADRVVARETEDFAAVALEVTDGRGVDVILDLVGASYLAKHQQCLAVLGRHVVLGLLGGAKAELDLSRVLARRQSMLGLIMRMRPLADRIPVVERFRRDWLGRLANGELSPIVDSTFPLAEAARAHAHMETNTSFGKIVLSVTAVD
jgi:putative PIG3 family NAD(P)H quinone oxidoreductase